MTPQFQPMLLGRRAAPFDHPDWLFELKYDGFRALALVEAGQCKLISRNGNAFGSFRLLCASLPWSIRARSVVLDGEIVCLDDSGRSVFSDLFYRRREPIFAAFDVLALDGDDLRSAALRDRKQILRRILKRSSAALYCDYFERSGEELFRLACEHDLEGIVAKRKNAPYVSGRNHTTWFKIRNRSYSQWAGREQMFERERLPQVAKLT